MVRSVGRITTKIHRYDCLGNPLEIIVSKGKTHDNKVAINLLQNIYKTKIIADRAYHSNEIREHIESISCQAFILCKSNKINPIPFDKQVYKEIHLIENFFSKIKHFKRVFSRFDKTISAYIGMIKLAFGYVEKLFLCTESNKYLTVIFLRNFYTQPKIIILNDYFNIN